MKQKKKKKRCNRPAGRSPSASSCGPGMRVRANTPCTFPFNTCQKRTKVSYVRIRPTSATGASEPLAIVLFVPRKGMIKLCVLAPCPSQTYPSVALPRFTSQAPKPAVSQPGRICPSRRTEQSNARASNCLQLFAVDAIPFCYPNVPALKILLVGPQHLRRAKLLCPYIWMTTDCIFRYVDVFKYETAPWMDREKVHDQNVLQTPILRVPCSHTCPPPATGGGHPSH